MPTGYPDYGILLLPLPLAWGGLGVTTLAQNGVLYGNGGNPVGVTAAGNAGDYLGVPWAGGAPAFQPASSVNVASLAGADFGAKMAAAMATGKSVLDCRGLTGAQAINATVTLDRAVRVILGAATITAAADPAFDVTATGVTIEGVNPVSAKIVQTVTTGNCIHIAPGIADVTIQQLALVAYPKALDEANFHQGNCIFAGAGSGLAAASAVIERVTVRDCLLTSGNNGVVFRYVNHGQVSNCGFLSGAAGLGQVLLVTSKYCAISSNTFNETAGDANAIYLRPLAADVNNPSQGNAIIGNAISGNYAFEIVLVFGAQNTVQGNTITNLACSNNSIGIGCYQNTSIPDTTHTTYANAMVGNSIVLAGAGGAGNAGISIQGGTTAARAADRNVVSGNIIDLSGLTAATANALVLSNSYITRTIIGHNQILGPGTASGPDAILIAGQNASDTLVDGNQINAAGGNGINCAGVRTSLINNRVANSANSSASAIFVPTGAGNAADSIITGNHLYNNAGRGLAISAGSGTGMHVWGNLSLSNGLVDSVGVVVGGEVVDTLDPLITGDTLAISHTGGLQLAGSLKTGSGALTLAPATPTVQMSGANALAQLTGTGFPQFLAGKDGSNAVRIYYDVTGDKAYLDVLGAHPLNITYNGAARLLLDATGVVPQSVLRFVPNVVSSSAGTTTADLLTGNLVQTALTENTTLALQNVAKGQRVTLIIVQNASAAKTFGWPVGVHGGGTVSTTLSSINVQEFIVSNNGTDLYAVGAMQTTTGGTP